MTYDQFWQRLATVYDRHEAQAVARTVLDTVFGMTLTDICCGKVTQLSADEGARLEKIIRRLEKSEPVQYVLGEAWFCGRRFTVRPGVLIPRPETEDLAAWAVELSAQQAKEQAQQAKEQATQADGGATQAPRLLDIGTGSGCLAATLALDIPGAEVTAWDISPDALAIASDNARQLGARVTFSLRDALHAPADDSQWSLIVSNPPYILERERTAMHRNVTDYEPPLALFVPDDDPLLFYRAIARYALRALRPGSWLLFEANTAFADDVAAMGRQLGFRRVEVRPDRFGRQRDVAMQRA